MEHDTDYPHAPSNVAGAAVVLVGIVLVYGLLWLTDWATVSYLEWAIPDSLQQ